MQYSPYYDTYRAYITYIVNIDAYMVNSQLIILKNSVIFVCGNKTLTSCPMGRHKIKKLWKRKSKFCLKSGTTLFALGQVM